MRIFSWLSCAVLGALLLTGGAARAQLVLTEINDAPGPEHPGVTAFLQPIGSNIGEATGVSVVDVNQDGWIDLFFHGTEGIANQLYMNNKDGSFTDMAMAMGVAEPLKRRSHSLFIDYDNDGDLDLATFGYPGVPDVVINLDLYSFFRNDDNVFTEVTAATGGFVLAPTSQPTVNGYPGGAAATDYDGDGYVDFLVTYFMKGLTPDFLTDQFRLWHNVPNPDYDPEDPNDSPRMFVDATLEAGLDHPETGLVWTVTWVDLDRDGDPDLHINIELGIDLLMMNNGDGTFAPNSSVAANMNYNADVGWGNEMGTAAGDMDNDGDIDFYLTNAGADAQSRKDAFYRNDSDLSEGGAGVQFTFVGDITNVSPTALGVGWGAVFADIDNDGDKDLLTARGLGTLIGGSHTGEAVNASYRNLFPVMAPDGLTPAFESMVNECPDFSGANGGTPWTSRSLGLFDMDNDGDLDAVTTRSGSSPTLPVENVMAGIFRNDSPVGNSLQVAPIESNGSLNVAGVRCFVRAGGVEGVVQMSELIVGDSFLVQHPYRLHFGLGAESQADWVVARWLDGGHSVVVGGVAPLAGLRRVRRDGLSDRTGDLDDNGVLDCDDLAIFSAGVNDPGFVDSRFPDWPWRILADADGNNILDGRDLMLLRAAMPDAICDIGNNLVGGPGVHPTLAAAGTLVRGTPISITIEKAPAGSVMWLPVGFSGGFAPYFGGSLVPRPDVILGPFVMPASETFAINGIWPAGLGPDLQLLLQVWVEDATASEGWAASNALSFLTP